MILGKGIMRTMRLITSKNAGGEPYCMQPLSQQPRETLYRNSNFLAGSVAEHRIAKSPALNGSRLFYFF